MKGREAKDIIIGETESTRKWANAKTSDGSMWVWIPRYAYSITSGYHSSSAGKWQRRERRRDG